MLKPIYIRNNENAIIKPLGINGEIPKFNIHFLPRLEGLNNISTIECQGDDCYLCKVIDWLKSSNLEEVVKTKFKEAGTHFNSSRQSIYILPAYKYNNSYWNFGYIRLFENQFITLVDYLEMNNLYEIGSPTNQDTLLLKQDKWNYIISKGSIPFIVTDIGMLQSNYNEFIKALSNPANFGIVSDPTIIHTINYHIYNYIQRMLQR